MMIIFSRLVRTLTCDRQTGPQNIL